MHGVALTIAGSDSGGGAGIQADLRAFAHFGVHGCTAITALTAQNPFGVSAIQAATPHLLAEQLNRISEAFTLGAIKTGMLVNAELIEVVTHWGKKQSVPLVIDPVMVATSGARLIDTDATAALLHLTSLATLITPNIPEAEALLNETLHSANDFCRAASALRHVTGAKHVLLKGGHCAERPGTDFYCNAQGEVFTVTAPCIPHPLTTHGTGCTLASAIAANIALGYEVQNAIVHAKAYLVGALRGAVATGKSAVFALPVVPCDTTEISIIKL